MTRRTLWRVLAALGIVLALAVVVAGIGVWRGWFDEGSVEGTTEGFRPREAPKGEAGATSWPEYGFDPERTRANPALALAPPFRQVWRHDAGALLEFPPVVGGGRVFVGTNAGRMLALDARTGGAVWSRRLVGRVAASPALAGQRLVLVTTTRGLLYALDQRTGGVVWRRSTGSSSESSPVVLDGDAYIGNLDGEVLRVDLTAGRPVWTAKAGGAVKSSLARSGDLVVVGDYSGKVTAFRRRDGRVMWQTTSPGKRFQGAGRFYGGPGVAYGRVFIGNVNGRVVALSADRGDVAWVRVLSDYVYSSPAVDRRLVMVGSYDQRLHALDAVTGDERWSFDAGERISGSPTVIGRLVWFATLARNPREGRTYALDVRTGRHVLTFPDGRYTPAVGIDGLLVLTGVRTLYGLTPRR